MHTCIALEPTHAHMHPYICFFTARPQSRISVLLLPDHPLAAALKEFLAKLQPFQQDPLVHVGKNKLISCPGHPVMIEIYREPGDTRALQLERGHFPKGGDGSW